MRPMYFVVPALALIGFLARPQTADAQTLTYTLSGVTFTDGATAIGAFGFDPTSGLFGPFDITTYQGNSSGDFRTGAEYSPVMGSAGSDGHSDIFSFDSNISGGGPVNSLTLVLTRPATAPGTYSLVPGVLFGGGFSGSGEYAPENAPFGPRPINAGQIIVTGPAAVPELSTNLAFGLGAVGLGGLIIRTRRKKPALS